MKREQYILKIEQPCKKEWSSMIGGNIERYCSSCGKNVRDFTFLTDKQVIEIIKINKGKVCGRLTEKQLQKEFNISTQNISSSIIPKFLSGLFLFGFFESVKANNLKVNTKITDTYKVKENSKALIKDSKETHTDSIKNTIQGQVIDAVSKEPLAFVNVIVKNSKTVAATDESGNFRLTIPENLLNERVVLVFDYLGYNSKEFSVDLKNSLLNEKVLMIKAEPILMGEVIIIKKKKWWQFWKRNKKNCSQN
jgi:hypothetical protein